MSLKVLIILVVHIMLCINIYTKSQAKTVRKAYNLISFKYNMYNRYLWSLENIYA